MIMPVTLAVITSASPEEAGGRGGQGATGGPGGHPETHT
jgi:hypothetical protein